LHKELFSVVHVSSSLLTGAALTIGGAMTLALNFMVDQRAIFTMQLTDSFWWLLLLFAILTAIGYNLYSSLLKRYSPTFISFASFLEPAFGMMYAAVFLGHTISILSFVALGALGGALYLFYQEELRNH
jgi:drug/metabolite transporter (DMT)-like permease